MKDQLVEPVGYNYSQTHPKKEDEMEKSKIRWINQSSGGRVHLGEEVVELVIPASASISEVEKIEGRTNERSALYDYPKSFEVLLRKGRSPLMVLQNLKETDKDRQELAAELV